MDKKAVAILLSTYWSPQGWKRERNTPAADLEYAKSRGVMFDPLRLNHDQVMEKALLNRDALLASWVADAFVSSLGSRSLACRSALGSFALLQNFPRHRWAGSGRRCGICGGYGQTEAELIDLNVRNFERLKWGGVRHLELAYATYDLEWFRSLDRAVPSPGDLALLKDLLHAIEQAPAGTAAAGLEPFLPKAIKSNKSERNALIGILGIAGILETKDHPGFRCEFIPESGRQLPHRRFVDMAYPACWWTSGNGISSQAVSDWFGHLL